MYALLGGEERINFLLRGFRTGRIIHREGKFEDMNFSREVLHWVNLPEFLYKISLYVLLSLYRFNFRREDVKGNCLG